MKNTIQIQPTSPAQYSDCEFWFAGDRADSFTLDGTYVDQWSDLSGNGRHVLNSNGDATRPTYDEDTGRVTFVAANSTYLANAGFASALAQPNTIFIVAKILTPAGTAALYTGKDATDRNQLYYSGNLFKNTAGTILNGRATDGNDNIHCTEFNGVNSMYWFNGGLISSGNMGASSLDGFQIGALQWGGLYYADAELCECFGFNRRLSAAERTGLTLYLQKKWNI